jgi:hypothetical protein
MICIVSSRVLSSSRYNFRISFRYLSQSNSRYLDRRDVTLGGSFGSSAVVLVCSGNGMSSDNMAFLEGKSCAKEVPDASVLGCGAADDDGTFTKPAVVFQYSSGDRRELMEYMFRKTQENTRSTGKCYDQDVVEDFRSRWRRSY